MKTMKERMAEAAARRKAWQERLEAEALQRGVVDVDAYVKARLELEYGLDPYDPPEPDDPCLPPGQTLH